MYAYLCRYGRQSIRDLLGRVPTPLEMRLFKEALFEFMKDEYESKDPLTRHED